MAAADREHPDGLVVVAPPSVIDAAVEGIESGLDALRESLRDGDWAGTPNALSPQHVEWPAIDDVAVATRKPRTTVIPRDSVPPGPEGSAVGPGQRFPGRLPHSSSPQRRRHGRRRPRSPPRPSSRCSTGSCHAPASRRGTCCPGRRACTPSSSCTAWTDSPAGCISSIAPPARSRSSARPCGRRSPGNAPKAAPAGLPLFRLEEGDTRSLARFASCHQEIASDSAFAVAMLADFRELDDGPWWYRRLHWEAGVLGQALYLEAEAAGVRGTGIGCFFDDVVHETLGLGDRRFRDLYHFTVGGAVDDRRLTTTPGYDDAVRRRV